MAKAKAKSKRKLPEATALGKLKVPDGTLHLYKHDGTYGIMTELGDKHTLMWKSDDVSLAEARMVFHAFYTICTIGR